MRHTIGELLDVVYRFHPRGIAVSAPGYASSEENRRLVAARLEAGAPERYVVWRGLLRRLGGLLPGHELTDRSQHLGGGTLDACYAARIELRPVGGERDRELGLLVSFLVPAYVVYRSCFFASDKTLPIEERSPRQEIGFDFTDAEVPIVRAVAGAIESCFPGYAPMPPEVGDVVVPDVDMGWTDVPARLYDLLFMNEW